MNAITEYLSSRLERFQENRSSDFSKACCPFHKERNPSMGIKKSSGTFNCFACGAQGGLAELISHVEMVSLDEAIRKVIYLRKV